jgi:hypothetical protein
MAAETANEKYLTVISQSVCSSRSLCEQHAVRMVFPYLLVTLKNTNMATASCEVKAALPTLNIRYLSIV